MTSQWLSSVVRDARTWLPLTAVLLAAGAFTAAAKDPYIQDRIASLVAEPNSPLPHGATRIKVEYGDDFLQRMDVYIPNVSSSVPRTSGTAKPVVVWIHPGGFWEGERTRAPSVWPLRAGYVFVSVSYRFTRVFDPLNSRSEDLTVDPELDPGLPPGAVYLSQAAPWPAQIEDVKAAVRHLRANAAAYEIDPNRILAWGASAGGHLALALGMAGDRLVWDVGKNRELPKQSFSSRVQGVIAYYPPTDAVAWSDYRPGTLFWNQWGFGAQSNTVRALLNQPLVFPEPPANPADPNQVFAATAQDRERLAEFSPAHYLTSDDPPTKLYHAYLDPTVPYLQSLGLLNRNAQGAFIAMDLVVHDPAADCPTSKCYHGAGRFDSGYYDFDNTEFARVYVTDLPDSANRVPRGQLVFDAVTRSSSASSVIDPDSPATPLRIQYVLHAPLGSGGERSGPPTQTSDAHRHDIPAVPALAPSDGGTSTRVYLYALDPFTGAEKLVASTVVTASNAPRAQLVFDHATRRIRASAVIDPAAPQTQLQIQFVLHAPLGQPGSETFGPLFNTGVDHSFESPVPTDLPITGSGLTRVYLYAKIGSSLVLVSSAVIPQP